MKKHTILGLCSAAAALAFASSANATPTDEIRYSLDGGSTWTYVADGSGADTNPNDNNIGVNLIGSSFVVNISSSGFESGTSANPSVDLGVSGHTTGSGSLNLVVEYSDVGFTPIPTGSFITHFFQSGGPSATEYTVIGNGGALFSGADISGGVPTGPTVIGPIGPFSLGSGSSIGFGAPTDPYSITLVETFTGSGSISSDAHLTVPDGGSTMMLLGSALSVLGFGVFRKSRKA